MGAPVYQFLKIKNHDPRVIIGQLKSLDLSDKPIVLDLLELGQNQLDSIQTIEDYFSQGPLPKFPYSIYILSDCMGYNGDLYIVSEKYQLPQFYNKKAKALTNKEDTYINKIQLKQENFKSLVPVEYMNSLTIYANGHRKISQKQSFQVYLETINKGLKDFYGKKEK